VNYKNLVIHIHGEIVRVHDEGVFRIRMHGQRYLFGSAWVRLVVFDILIKHRMGNSGGLEKLTDLDNVVHALAPIQLCDL